MAVATRGVKVAEIGSSNVAAPRGDKVELTG